MTEAPAQGLHGRELADDGPAGGHARDAHGQDDGHGGGQAFGDGAHGQGHGGHEHVGGVFAVQ